MTRRTPDVMGLRRTVYGSAAAVVLIVLAIAVLTLWAQR